MLSIKAKAQFISSSKIVDSISSVYYYPNYYEFVSAKRISNNEILLLSYTLKPSTISSQPEIDSIKIDKYALNGQLKWSKKIAYIGYVCDYIESANNDIILLITDDINLDEFNTIVELDSNGNFINSKSLIYSDNLIKPKKIVDAKDGSYLILSKLEVFEAEDYCWSLFFPSYTNSYNVQTYLTKINADLDVVWNTQLTNNYMHLNLYDYSYAQIDYYPTIIDVLDDNDHTINIVHQVKQGYDMENQLKLENYNSLNGAMEFEKILLDSLHTAEKNCDFNQSFMDFNFSIQKWENKYVSINSYHENGQNITRRINFNLQGDTIENTILNQYDFINPFTTNPYYYNKNFAQAGENLYAATNFFNSNESTTLSLYKGNKNLEVLWTENMDNQNHFNNGILLNTELTDTSIVCVQVIKDNTDNDSVLDIQFIEISLTGNQLFYTLYIDRNNNGTNDINDTLCHDGLIEITNYNNSSIDYTPYDNGTFSKIVGKGTYTSKLIDYNQQLKYYIINPNIHTTVFDSINQTDSIIFRLTPKPNIQDLQISIVPTIGARPGFNSSYKIIAKNVGTKTMYSPMVKFIKDSLQTFTDSLTYVFDRDTLFWQIDSLSLLEQREIVVSVLNAIPPTLNANDTFHLAAIIYPFENDSFVQDNYASLNQIVRNSVDPNDKIETHGGNIPYSAIQNRDYLYYTIRFQNTGNSYASRVVITDTLTDNVDVSTLENISSSVPFVMNVVDRKYITWTATNTYLPDSTSDETNSHGYISFRIKPKVGLLPSDEITNRASIVFDYNAAILTNTCTTNIIEQRILSVKNNEIKSIHLFPNPTNGNVQLNMNLLQNKNYTMRIIDINGNLLSNENLKGNAGENNVSIDLSTYANGLYFIQVSDETGNLFYGKVVKQ